MPDEYSSRQAAVSLSSWNPLRTVRRTTMRWASKAVLILTAALLLPSAAFAQGTLTGTVRDESGGVLPGVSVEAASPVLIEKVRTAVTDGAGQYRITGLNPGTYSLTVRLSGFNIVRREG